MKQFTREQAIALHDSRQWEQWDDELIVSIQLFQKKLFVPFNRFHQAVEKVLNRPVWTHEFADVKLLQDEFNKKVPAPASFDDIIKKLLSHNLSGGVFYL